MKNQRIDEWAKHGDPKISPSVNRFHRLSATLQWYVPDSEKRLDELATVCEQEGQRMVESRMPTTHTAEGVWRGDS